MKHYPIIPWPGGKRRLAKKLNPIFDNRKHSCYVEAFAGGGSMLFMRQSVESEVLNDINADVVNGKVSSRTFGISPSSAPRFNYLRLETDLMQAHDRLCRVCIESLDWHTCITKWDRDYTLFFLDPPYWQTEGYGVPFPLDEYERIAELMRSIKGAAVLTINDHPDMRRIFKGYKMDSVDIDYTIGGGGKCKGRKELIYRNW